MKKNFLFLMLSLLISKVSYGVDLQNFYFSDSYRWSFLDDSGILKHPGNWVFMTSIARINDPLVISDEGSSINEGIVLDDQTVLNLGFSYYLKRWLSVGIDASYILTTLSDDSTALNFAQNEANAKNFILGDGGNLGDITLRAKIRLLRLKSSKIALALIPRITFGTGKVETFTSSGNLRWGLLAVAEKLWKRWSVQLGLGYSQSKDANYSVIDYDQLINFQAGLAWRMTKKLNLNFELVRNFSIGTEDGNDQDFGDYYLTAKYRAHKNFDVYAGAGVAGFSDIDEENYTLFAGLKFHPARKSKTKKVIRESELESISDLTATPNVPINKIDINDAVTGQDKDSNGNAIIYTCNYDNLIDEQVYSGSECNTLSGFAFDNQTGAIQWNPSKDQVGNYEFKIDGYVDGKLIDDEIFNIRVIEEVTSREDERSLGVLYKSDRVFFDNSSSRIKNSENAKLNELADYLITNASNVSKVIIEGYASKIGPSALNRKLSIARSENVKKFLIDMGVDGELLQTVAYGDDYLNAEPEEWQNRRVEFRIYNQK